MGKTDEAIKSFKRTIVLNPQFTENYTNLGSLLDENERYLDAFEIFNNLVQVKPKYIEGYTNKALITIDKALKVKKRC